MLLMNVAVQKEQGPFGPAFFFTIYNLQHSTTNNSNNPLRELIFLESLDRTGDNR